MINQIHSRPQDKPKPSTSWRPRSWRKSSGGIRKSESILTLISRILLLGVVAVCSATDGVAGEQSRHDQQVATALKQLAATDATVRIRAVSALGWLRARSAIPALVSILAADPTPTARVNAAMSLGWCAGRTAVPALIKALGDEDWTVRQAAGTALQNLSGESRPFTADAPDELRKQQCAAWQAWANRLVNGRLPDSVREALSSPDEEVQLRAVRATGLSRRGRRLQLVGGTLITM
jgi:HEAT repeat protein